MTRSTVAQDVHTHEVAQVQAAAGCDPDCTLLVTTSGSTVLASHDDDDFVFLFSLSEPIYERMVTWIQRLHGRAA